MKALFMIQLKPDNNTCKNARSISWHNYSLWTWWVIICVLMARDQVSFILTLLIQEKYMQHVCNFMGLKVPTVTSYLADNSIRAWNCTCIMPIKFLWLKFSLLQVKFCDFMAWWIKKYCYWPTSVSTCKQSSLIHHLIHLYLISNVNNYDWTFQRSLRHCGSFIKQSSTTSTVSVIVK